MPGCLGPHTALCPGDNIKQVRTLLPAYAVHPKKQPLQVRLPGGLGDKESRMGRGRWGSVPSPASKAWRSACRAEEALRLDECLSPGILGRPRSLGEGHLPKATQSLVVELGLQLAPFSAHSACLGLEDSDTPVVPQTENLSPGEGRESLRATQRFSGQNPGVLIPGLGGSCSMPPLALSALGPPVPCLKAHGLPHISPLFS